MLRPELPSASTTAGRRLHRFDDAASSPMRTASCSTMAEVGSKAGREARSDDRLLGLEVVQRGVGLALVIPPRQPRDGRDRQDHPGDERPRFRRGRCRRSGRPDSRRSRTHRAPLMSNCRATSGGSRSLRNRWRREPWIQEGERGGNPPRPGKFSVVGDAAIGEIPEACERLASGTRAANATRARDGPLPLHPP